MYISNESGELKQQSTNNPMFKQIKVQLSKKEKKDNFGIVLGCKYFIEEIIEDSLADYPEVKLRPGDAILKVS